MFETSHPFLFCDYFGLPHVVVPALRRQAPLGMLRWRRGGDPAPPAGPALYWPCGLQQDGSAAWPGGFRLEGLRLHGRLLPDEAACRLLVQGTSGGERWAPAAAVRDAQGRQVASVWRGDGGSVLLPFDPDECVRSFWSEAYAGTKGRSGGRRAAMRAYYRLRPLLPRAAQLRLRRLFARAQARATFPQWPVETALHDFYRYLFQLLGDLAGGPLPWLAPWPRSRSWALVLTHDVETAVGYRELRRLRDIEERGGLRSSWNFVPRRYTVEDELVAELTHAGHEVGVHGLYHDGRDLESSALLARRLPEMRAYARRWNASGFRSPATHRVWDWMPLLGFDYDSSYPDTDPFEPQGGGCCSWLPFFNRDLVELPITLAQDHTLFAIQQQPDGAAWLRKTDFLRQQGGMALLITHPDYMLATERLAAYERLLAHAQGDSQVWPALPREVSAWWRRRAASRIEPDGAGWKVAGPAAGEAALRFFAPGAAQAA